MAGMKAETVEFFCSACDQDTEHRVRYVGSRLATIACRHCGRTIGIPRSKLVGYYTGNVAERLMTKPFRMAHELRERPERFLLSLPTRVFTKPLRVARELTGVIAEAAND